MEWFDFDNRAACPQAALPAEYLGELTRRVREIMTSFVENLQRMNPTAAVSSEFGEKDGSYRFLVEIILSLRGSNSVVPPYPAGGPRKAARGRLQVVWNDAICLDQPLWLQVQVADGVPTTRRVRCTEMFLGMMIRSYFFMFGKPAATVRGVLDERLDIVYAAGSTDRSLQFTVFRNGGKVCDVAMLNLDMDSLSLEFPSNVVVVSADGLAQDVAADVDGLRRLLDRYVPRLDTRLVDVLYRIVDCL